MARKAAIVNPENKHIDCLGSCGVITDSADGYCNACYQRNFCRCVGCGKVSQDEKICDCCGRSFNPVVGGNAFLPIVSEAGMERDAARRGWGET